MAWLDAMTQVVVPGCMLGCGRAARAKGLCAVCYEYRRRRQMGKSVRALDLVELRVEVELLRSALHALVDALHDSTSDGPALVGRAGEAAIAVLARAKNP